MTKSIITVLALMLASVCSAQYVPSVPATHVNSSCTLPSDVIYDYTGWNSSNTCGTTGGSSCTSNGQAFFSYNDPINGNTASQSNTSDQPTYATNFLNSLAGVTYNGSSDFLSPGTTIPTSDTNFTFMAVFNLSTASVNNGLMGTTSGSALDYLVNSSNHMVLALGGTGAIGTGSTTLAASTNYAFLATWNKSTGAWQIWRLASGSATSDGSGTQSETLVNPTWSWIGEAKNGSGTAVFLHGTLVEITASISAPTASTYATYVNCKYGL